MSLESSFSLPCGLTLQNRLVKAAMAEGMADGSAKPNAKHSTLYREWAEGGWGAILTGNVQVDSKHLGSPGDIAPSADETEREKTLEVWKKWAGECQANGTPAIVQLNHPGRQSPVVARKGQAMGPSAVALNIGNGIIAQLARWLVFGTPKAMTVEEIQIVVKQFASAAKLASDAGFKGVELHAAHGYLLSQFLSPLSNTRTDDYGGSPKNRARIIKEIMAAVRAATPAGFCVGIKINSADHQQENGLEECLEQVEFITEEQVDFLEISGGTYEDPKMMKSDVDEDEPRGGEAKRTERTAKREAFFLEYAHEVRRKFPSLPLMVTGGFRSRRGMQAAVDEGGCDMVGIGRPSAVTPKLPTQIILNKEIPDEDANLVLEQIKTPWIMGKLGLGALGAGMVTIHFQKAMKQLAVAH
ncbi:Hypothetical protein R9X50_00686900 [Acrodontium crateriforme]|uniref:NADH:flavin oxidoreductase/NADH oxidase N-terminal domain-containing protein n=1 Tax=Acrodontium crateriforme TaxID=150365 RepID=A0AAQ3MCC0_9PEZI|nr:Hypothetical protein R9X50_00686900 [Acrodontium crateriforme]